MKLIWSIILDPLHLSYIKKINNKIKNWIHINNVIYEPYITSFKINNIELRNIESNKHIEYNLHTNEFIHEFIFIQRN